MEKTVYLLPLHNKWKINSTFIHFYRTNSTESYIFCDSTCGTHHYQTSPSLQSKARTARSLLCAVLPGKECSTACFLTLYAERPPCAVCVSMKAWNCCTSEKGRADTIESNWSWTKHLIFLLWKIQCYLDGNKVRVGWGELFSSICDLACDTKATHCPLCFPVLTAAPS